MKTSVIIGFILLNAAYAVSSHAQTPEQNPTDVTQCASIQNLETRYACYDKVTEHMRNNPATAEPQQQQQQSLPPLPPPRNQAIIEQPATPAEASEKPPIDNFGISIARLDQNSAGDEVLHDRIVKLTERIPSQFIITLESGQIWYQTITKNYRLREGMEVEISLSPFGGSYRLSSPSNKGFIQVKRIE